jgi:PIN domain nuclease of toxin-antitoxin system
MWGQKLGTVALTAILEPENHLYLSAASYWEICIKLSIGKLDFKENWRVRFDDEIELNQILWLPITKEHCQKITQLPTLHNDPFDRLLIAQALCEEMMLLTADKNITRYPVPTLW